MRESLLLEKLQASRRVLVIKQRYLGDAIWTLPFLENLKLNLPGARVTVLCNAGTDPFFYENDYIDDVIPYPNKEVKKGGLGGALAFVRFLRRLRALKADTVIDLTDSDKSCAFAFLSGAPTRIGFSCRSKLRHRVLNHVVSLIPQHWVAFNLEFLQRIGLKVLTREIHNRTPESAFSSLRALCPTLFAEDGRGKIVVHPGARMPLRQWGGESYARLCDLLSGYCRIFLAAGPDEGGILAEVLGRMTAPPEFASSTLGVQEFAALCELCDCFVGNDSGPIHIAATKTFTVGIYGPNSDRWAGPWSGRKHVFEDNSLSCRTSCDHRTCTNAAHHACMTCTTPEMVAAKVREVLGASLAEEGAR